MKQYGNQISIIPCREVYKVSGGIITPKQGGVLSTFYTHNDVDPDDRPADSNGNAYYKQSLKVFVEMSKADIDRFKNSRNLVVLYDSQGGSYIWGTVERGVRSSIVPNISGIAELSLTFESLNPLHL